MVPDVPPPSDHAVGTNLSRECLDTVQVDAGHVDARDADAAPGGWIRMCDQTCTRGDRPDTSGTDQGR